MRTIDAEPIMKFIENGLKPMEQRNEPTTAELIKSARYCCGDIKCEGEKDCGDYCLDGRDERNGDLRWCRQWLVHDLADRLEQLERESVRITDELTAMTARAEKAEEEQDAAYERGYENGFNNLLEAQDQ